MLARNSKKIEAAQQKNNESRRQVTNLLWNTSYAITTKMRIESWVNEHGVREPLCQDDPVNRHASPYVGKHGMSKHSRILESDKDW